MKSFKGLIIQGQAIGNHFGIATANIKPKLKPSMRQGVYLANCIIDQKNYSGIMHFGDLKTFGGDFSIEIHLLNIHKNLYGKNITITPLKYHREIQNFQNADLLYTQIEADIIAAQKFFLRKNIIKHWENLSSQEKKELYKKSIKALAEDTSFQKAKTIALYAGTNHELQFAKEICAQFPQKIFLFPKVISKTELVFIESSYENLIQGQKNILEPQTSLQTSLEKIDLIITPGLAADKNKNRLGQGGGFYDRILENYKGESLFLVPDFAIISQIPVSKHDKGINRILTV